MELQLSGSHVAATYRKEEDPGNVKVSMVQDHRYVQTASATYPSPISQFAPTQLISLFLPNFSLVAKYDLLIHTATPVMMKDSLTNILNK